MPISNSDNLFGISPFIVDPTGVSGSYTTINSAMFAAAGVIGGTVYVRYTGTPYVEDLQWPEKVDIIGVCGDGRLGQVVVDGRHTCSSQGEHTALNMTFTNTIDNSPVWTFNAVGVDGIIAFENCKLTAPGGGSIMLMDPTLGANAAVACSQCDINSDLLDQFILNDNCFLNMQLCGSDANFAHNIRIAGVNSQATIQDCDLTSRIDNITLAVATNSLTISNSSFTTDVNGSVIDFQSSNGTATISNSKVDCTEASNFWVKNAGDLRFASIAAVSPGNVIDPGVNQFPLDWQPYATGTTVGTASFNGTDFNVSSTGQVSLTTPSLVWTNYAAPATVTGNSGSFIDAAITLSLPSPGFQGATCEFVCTSAGPCVIQAQGADKIFIGTGTSSAGGTATSTAGGDSIKLVYQIVTASWYSAGGPQGNWVLA